MAVTPAHASAGWSPSDPTRMAVRSAGPSRGGSVPRKKIRVSSARDPGRLLAREERADRFLVEGKTRCSRGARRSDAVAVMGRFGESLTLDRSQLGRVEVDDALK
ncbi:predicted protein [Uncinocarpus reesii 1704]|uniref:Uncharacterized protein n=1 Tax=Uncinocarpus reesii (strain UAMH 1704) TaxID=336963 RepID=C4JR26_UNCRE|nr:uncharacterized protein UREG_03508 [Uncinocarpus reesii 1704]EEP78662.1 predicted protein [Uncinocarpus reesii 1704]